MSDSSGYPRRIAALIRDAALALQAVHDLHIIHRDVKPANFVVTPDGSRIVLLDFGLARGPDGTTGITRTGGPIGTLRYMAPEQLAGTAQIGPATDVRGLGAVLWELLTRRRLFGEMENEAQLARMIDERDVPLLRSIEPGFDRDLEAIVARATERRVSDRIPSARMLAQYLDLYLQGSPLPIRPPTVLERTTRWLRRNPAGAALIVMSANCVVLGAVLVMTLAARSTRGSAGPHSLLMLAVGFALGSGNTAVVLGAMALRWSVRDAIVARRKRQAELVEQEEGFRRARTCCALVADHRHTLSNTDGASLPAVPR